MRSPDNTPPPVHPCLCLNETIFISPCPPCPALWKAIVFQRLWKDLNAVARRIRQQITSVPNPHRMAKMLMQMIDKFDHAILKAAGHRQIIKHRKVLNVFAKPDTSRVRTNRNTELRGHQQDCQVLVHARNAAAVDLT